MGDAESQSKKRAAGREISRDNPGLDDDDATEQETGTFKRASDDVLANRRIVKVRRNQTPAAPSFNPFANISLVPPPDSNSKVTQAADEVQPVAEEPLKEEAKETPEADRGEKDLDKTEPKEKDELEVESAENTEKKESANKGNDTTAADQVEPVGDGESRKALGDEESGKTVGDEETAKEGNKDRKDDGHEDAAPSGGTVPLSSFGQLSSSQNAFTGFVGTGFSGSSFSFGTSPKEGDTPGVGSGSIFGLNTDNSSSFPTFSFGTSSNGSSSLFGASGASDTTKSENVSFPPKQEVSVETGEENEKSVFAADAVLFEYVSGGWKERGKGEIKVNVATADAEKARLLMRARGNYRLILNASLYPDMKLTNMDKRGVTFACMNSSSDGEGKGNLSTFAVKFKDRSVVEEFRVVVAAHQGKKAAVLKTPENSPKASDE
ncbi:hypothetical protein Sjap_019417 [Stephania japonica]|uniref:RanBD1 domain-containing protein n=1 Tax=Stephania japonica TaxID=461633 RepID=A0AAP0HUQ0_9MAGN